MRKYLHVMLGKLHIYDLSYVKNIQRKCLEENTQLTVIVFEWFGHLFSSLYFSEFFLFTTVNICFKKKEYPG